MSTIPRLATAAVALGVATTLAITPTASAHHGSHHRSHHTSLPATDHVLANGLLSPLRAAVAPDGTSYVSENFAGKIDRIDRDGAESTVYTDPDGNEVGGLSVAGRNVVFTVTQSGQEIGENIGSWLKVLTPSGASHTIADLHYYETQKNPDGNVMYGLADLDPNDPIDADCLGRWPTATMGPAASPGGVDSHPYATYALRNGWTYVADAGGNDVLLVSPRGRSIRTVATLPPIPLVIDAPTAAGLGLDSCFVGATYYFEPVPTDVEVGADGTVYVTSLPGGPEGPALGARGSVFAIHAVHGYGSDFRTYAKRHHHRGWSRQEARQIVTGLVEPTGLAVSPRGDLYVAQLFGDAISKVSLGRHGSTVTDVLTPPSPGDVEWGPGGLYYTDNVLSGTPEDPHGHTTTPIGELIRYGS
jgi:hypothetical protein